MSYCYKRAGEKQSKNERSQFVFMHNTSRIVKKLFFITLISPTLFAQSFDYTYQKALTKCEEMKVFSLPSSCKFVADCFATSFMAELPKIQAGAHPYVKNLDAVGYGSFMGCATAAAMREAHITKKMNKNKKQL